MFRAGTIVARIQLVHSVRGQMTLHLLSPDEATRAAEELSRRFGDAMTINLSLAGTFRAR